MNTPGFTFNGRHTSEFGLFVKTKESMLLPQRSKTRVKLPGRPGELVFDGEPENKRLTLSLTMTKPFSERRAAARAIAEWLSRTGSLVMDYEPDMRYEVVGIIGNVSTVINAGHDVFAVEFECEPYQYGLKRTYNGTTINAQNNGTAGADTIITLNCAGSVVVSAAGQSFALSSFSGTAVVDSKRMTVSSSGGQSLAHLHSGGFIRLPPGTTTVSVSGSASSAGLEFWEMWL